MVRPDPGDRRRRDCARDAAGHHADVHHASESVADAAGQTCGRDRSTSKQKDYDFVRFEPWVAYEERAAFFARFGAALLTFPQSIETDLSMRTRVYDYLWGGLPIVTSSAPGTDELLTRYGAGVVVRSTSATDFADALVRALRRARTHARRRAAIRRRSSVAAHARSRCVDFVRAPRIDPQKDAFAATLHVPEHPRSFLDRIKRRIGGSS